jgi:hypothetical protein
VFLVVSQPQACCGIATAQYPKGFETFCFQATFAFICLMTLLDGALCPFAIFPQQKWQKVLFRAFTTVVYVDFVIGQDVECCKIWMIWRQAETLMSSLER